MPPKKLVKTIAGSAVIPPGGNQSRSPSQSPRALGIPSEGNPGTTPDPTIADVLTKLDELTTFVRGKTLEGAQGVPARAIPSSGDPPAASDAVLDVVLDNLSQLNALLPAKTAELKEEVAIMGASLQKARKAARSSLYMHCKIGDHLQTVGNTLKRFGDVHAELGRYYFARMSDKSLLPADYVPPRYTDVLPAPAAGSAESEPQHFEDDAMED